MSSILSLLRQSNELETISCWSCANIGPVEREAVLNVFRKENLSVQFQLYSSRMVPYPDDLEELELVGLDGRDDMVQLVGVNILPDVDMIGQ